MPEWGTCLDFSETFLVVVHLEGCGQEKLTSLSSQEDSEKKNRPSILEILKGNFKIEGRAIVRMALKVREERWLE